MASRIAFHFKIYVTHRNNLDFLITGYYTRGVLHYKIGTIMTINLFCYRDASCVR